MATKTKKKTKKEKTCPTGYHKEPIKGDPDKPASGKETNGKWKRKFKCVKDNPPGGIREKEDEPTVRRKKKEPTIQKKREIIR